MTATTNTDVDLPRISEIDWGNPTEFAAWHSQVMTTGQYLPANIGGRNRRILEEVGVRFGKPTEVDPDFLVEAALPQGWLVVISDRTTCLTGGRHGYDLLDERGRTRARLIYRRNGGDDNSVSLGVVPSGRIETLLVRKDEEGFDWCCRAVMRGDEVIWRSPERQIIEDYYYDSLEREFRVEAEAVADACLPGWREDFNKFW